MKKEKKKEKSNVIQITIDKTKLFKGIGVIAAVALIIGLSFVASKSYSKDTKTFEFTNITIDEYLAKMKEEEKSIIYVARPDCSYCVKESPIIKRLGAEYDLEIFYLDTSDFVDYEAQDYTEDGYKFINSSDEYKEGFGTPNTIIVQNGEIVDGVFQYVEASELKDLFKRNGFLNE